MDSVGQYILSVGCAALCCAIALHLTAGDGVIGAVMKTATGVLLAFTILQPVGGTAFSFHEDLLPDFRAEAETAAAAGETERKNALSKVIKEKTEAYILDKAQQLHLDLTVQVELGGDGSVPVPTGVTLSGAAAPYAKAELLRILKADLGLDEVDILWI